MEQEKKKKREKKKNLCFGFRPTTKKPKKKKKGQIGGNLMTRWFARPRDENQSRRPRRVTAAIQRRAKQKGGKRERCANVVCGVEISEEDGYLIKKKKNMGGMGDSNIRG